MASSSASAQAQSLTDTKTAVLETLPADPVKNAITRLKEEQARIRQEKKDLSRALRNATKKQQRLRHRTRQMSDEDLVAALMMRKESQQAAEDKKEVVRAAVAGKKRVRGSDGRGDRDGDDAMADHAADGG